MFQIPITLIISICSFFPATTATLEKPTEIVEVIQSLPTHEIPTWQIGNVQYSTDDATVILEDNLPVIGNLAIVTYIASDNNNVAIEITPLSLQANEVDDGPYIFFDENDRLISVSMNKVNIKEFLFPFLHLTSHILTNIPYLARIAI